MMTPDSLIPVIGVLAGVIVGGGLQYLSSQALESKRQLVLQRSQSYIDFLKAVAVIAQNGRTKETLALAADAKTRMCIYGSSRAIQMLGEFERAGANTVTPEARSAIVALLKEMRADLGRSDRAGANVQLQEILFGHS
jgi:hypothetical protein